MCSTMPLAALRASESSNRYRISSRVSFRAASAGRIAILLSSYSRLGAVVAAALAVVAGLALVLD